MDDDVLAARFRHLADVLPVEPTDLDGLSRRVARRRRNQRLAGSSVTIALLMVGALAVQAQTATKSDPQRVASDRTLAPKAANFTIGVVPDGFAFETCELSPGEGPRMPDAISCRYSFPQTQVPDGVRVTRLVGGVTDELRAAWDAGDPARAAALVANGTEPVEPRFVSIADRQVLATGPIEELDGAPFGGADRKALDYAVIIGDDLVTVSAEGATDADIQELVAGIDAAAPDGAFTIDSTVLPRGTTQMVQGPRPRWIQPDSIRPELSRPAAGETFGILLRLPDADDLISVEVTEGIDAASYLEGLLADPTGNAQAVTLDDRPGVVVARTGMLSPTAVPPRSGPQVFLSLDDRTVVRVIPGDGDDALARTIATAIR